jgi:hypothetical protein
MYQACPKRLRREMLSFNEQGSTYATIAANSTPPQAKHQEDMDQGESHTDEVSHTVPIILETNLPDQGKDQSPMETASPQTVL